MNKKFWNLITNDLGEVELTIEGTIAQEESWWSDTITPKLFRAELEKVSDKPISLVINSGGGDVFAANAIYLAIKEHKGEVTAKIAFAASAATIIAMAADKIKIPASSYFMIHNPWSFAWGDANEMRKMADTLDTIKDGIMNAYIEKTGKSKDELSALMDAETWYTGDKAVENGFCDEVMFDPAPVQNAMNGSFMIVNSVSHDLSKFKNLPKAAEPPKNVTPPPAVTENNHTKGDPEMKIENAADLMAQNKAVYDEVHNSAVTAERNRIKAIDDIANSVDSELVAKAKAEGWTADQLALNAIKEGKFKNLQHVENLKKDAEGANKVEGDDAEVIEDEDAGVLNFVAQTTQKYVRK